MELLTNLDIVGGFIDLNKNELRNARIQQLGTAPSSPIEGQVYWNTGSHKLFVYSGSAWVDFYPSSTTLDAIAAPAADVSLNSRKLTNVATPTSSTDAATKGYVDGISQGISWKNTVRAATTTAGTLASSFANGSVVDGVTLATGDRVLIKNQSTGSENGIYTVNASGAPTRATDADTGAEVLAMACFVQEGTTNQDSAWVCTTNAPITLGTTSLAFVQFSSAGSYTFTSGVQVSGSTVSANVDGVYVQVNGSNQITIKPGSGGTARKYVGTISGDGSTTTFTVTHSMGTKDVCVSVRGTSSPYTDAVVYPDVKPNATASVDISFGAAPASGVNFSVTVLG